jgi:AbrB family looped-hinge helix DNA binding protein
MKVTQKGQVTIPNEIRKQFELLPHTEVEFVIQNNTVILKKAKIPSPKRSKFKELIGKAETTLSTEDIMALTRGDV